jgi:hypothetical protein
MALVNMKMSGEERGEYTGQPVEMKEPSYPYGLSIDLDDGSMEKLGITALPKVGTEMMIMAKVVVKSVSSNQYEGSDAESRMCLQITDMEISGEDKKEDKATALYGAGSEGSRINNISNALYGGS